MSKIYLNVNVKLIVDTDLTNVDEIAENLSFESFDDSEVMVLESEINDISVEDSK